MDLLFKSSAKHKRSADRTESSFAIEPSRTSIGHYSIKNSFTDLHLESSLRFDLGNNLKQDCLYIKALNVTIAL